MSKNKKTVTCDECGGTGILEDDECPFCMGDGRIDVDEDETWEQPDDLADFDEDLDEILSDEVEDDGELV